MAKIALKKQLLRNGLGTWTSAGVWFGFPKCCIEAFDQLKHLCKDTENWPLIGTGFVPCEKCATTKTTEALLEEIEANRFCPTPFPNGGGRSKVDKESKWLIKQLTGRLENVLDAEMVEQIKYQIDQRREEHRENKYLREVRLTDLSGHTARQLLLIKKHRRFFSDTWGGVFQISFPNAVWKDVKGEERIATYRSGKTRFVLAGEIVAIGIIDRVESLGVECAYPGNLKRRPLFETPAMDLIDAFELTRLKAEIDKHINNEIKGRVGSIVQSPYIFHKPAEMNLGYSMRFVGLPAGIEPLSLPIVREALIKKVREEAEKVREQSNFESTGQLLPKYFVIDSLSELGEAIVQPPKMPVDFGFVGEVTSDMILPASFRPKHGLTLHKED